jgi:hypothetical protein
MPFRVVTLNLEQDHKRWPARRPLIEAELARLKPDIVALNEVTGGACATTRDITCSAVECALC